GAGIAERRPALLAGDGAGRIGGAFEIGLEDHAGLGGGGDEAGRGRGRQGHDDAHGRTLLEERFACPARVVTSGFAGWLQDTTNGGNRRCGRRRQLVSRRRSGLAGNWQWRAARLSATTSRKGRGRMAVSPKSQSASASRRCSSMAARVSVGRSASGASS